MSSKKMAGIIACCIIVAIAIPAIVLTASGYSLFSHLQVGLNEEFQLSIGQCVFITGENLEVRFKEVVGDSRCPRGVICIWEGRVSCVVELAKTGSLYRMVLTEPGLTDEYTKERYEDYEIAFHVTPYPETGKQIAKDTYRLHLIINKLPELTEIISSIIAEPFAFEGENITIVGYYCGWDLLHEANTPPPVTRSDWVIKDSTGAIYISAHSEAKVPEGLSPDLLQDTDIVLKVNGIVRVNEEEQAYIEAKSVERVP
jgi:hypothetical protein